MFAKIEEKLNDFMSYGIPWNDLVIYHKGKCVYRSMRGTLDLEGKIPVTGKEKINIFSCSKVITCTAALMLYEKGLFRLGDLLSDYFPEYAQMTVKEKDGTLRAAKTPIRIKDLFCMTAGFTYDLRSPAMKRLREETAGVCATRDFARYLAEDPLAYEPGESWQYSLAHDVLAALVEAISDTDFDEFCKKNIFDPVGMKDTTFLLPYDEYNTVAPLYCHNAELGKPVPCSSVPVYRLGTEHASGGAGCVSTVDDYIHFLEALRCGELLSEATLSLMSSDALTDRQTRAYNGGAYSYGLGVRCAAKGSAVTEFGWGGAAGCYLTVDRKNEFTAFYAQHVLASPVQALRGTLSPAITEALGSAAIPMGDSDKSRF